MMGLIRFGLSQIIAGESNQSRVNYLLHPDSKVKKLEQSSRGHTGIMAPLTHPSVVGKYNHIHIPSVHHITLP